MGEYNEGMQKNELIQYYQDGWYAGYFISQVGKSVKIQPIPTSMKVIKVPVEDIRELQK